MPTVVAVPHLFQHIGSQSSLGSRPLHQSSLYAGGLDAAFASQRTVVLVHASGAKRLSRTQRCLVAALADQFGQQQPSSSGTAGGNSGRAILAWRVVILSNTLSVGNFTAWEQQRQRRQRQRQQQWSAAEIRLERYQNGVIFRGTPLQSWYFQWRQIAPRSQVKVGSGSGSGGGGARDGASLPSSPADRTLPNALKLALLYTHGGIAVDIDAGLIPEAPPSPYTFTSSSLSSSSHSRHLHGSGGGMPPVGGLVGGIADFIDGLGWSAVPPAITDGIKEQPGEGQQQEQREEAPEERHRRWLLENAVLMFRRGSPFLLEAMEVVADGGTRRPLSDKRTAKIMTRLLHSNGSTSHGTSSSSHVTAVAVWSIHDNVLLSC